MFRLRLTRNNNFWGNFVGCERKKIKPAIFRLLSFYSSTSRLQFQPLTVDPKQPTTEDMFPQDSFLIQPFEEKELGHLRFAQNVSNNTRY